MVITFDICCRSLFAMKKTWNVLLARQSTEPCKISTSSCTRVVGTTRGCAHTVPLAWSRYYTGEAVAPCLTLFVGGNHEASNYLRELHYGGWVAPNIFYLGTSGVVRYGGLRIGGVSGIYKAYDFRKPYFEKPPFDSGTIKSVFHARAYDYLRLGQVTGNVDVMVSHDWPQGIARHGDMNALFHAKPHLRDEVLDNSLGSPPSAMLLHKMKPAFWFSAHLHVKFAALVPHPPEVPPAAHGTVGYLGRFVAPPSAAAAAAAAAASAAGDGEIDLDAALDDAPTAAPKQSAAADGEIDLDDDLGAAAPVEPAAGVDTAATTTAAAVELGSTDAAGHEHSSDENGDDDDNDDDDDACCFGAESTGAARASAAPLADGEIDIDDELSGGARAVPSGPSSAAPTPVVLPLPPMPPVPVGVPGLRFTRFLSLSKPLPRSDFLQIVHVPVVGAQADVGCQQLCYDEEWLAIVKRTHANMNSDATPLPSPQVTPPELAYVRARLAAHATPQVNAAGARTGLYVIPPDCPRTVPAYDPSNPRPVRNPAAITLKGNPQTDALLALLELPHIVTVPYKPDAATASTGSA